MRLILSGLLVTLMSSSALATEPTSRLGLEDPVAPPPPVTPTETTDTQADVFIASSTNGGTFTDLAPTYGPAFIAAGAASVTAITDGAGTPFTFPVPFTSAEYGTACILSNENFWGPGNGNPNPAELNVSLQDEQRIASYMDTGGTLLFSGQDYLYARGNGVGFPMTYLGVASYTDDINFGDDSISYTGVVGSPMAGLSGTLFSAANHQPCWNTANTFYTDQVNPVQLGLVDWSSSSGSGQGGSTYVTGTYRTVFTTVELACTPTPVHPQFNRDIAAIYTFLRGGATPVAPSTWGQIKHRFSE